MCRLYQDAKKVAMELVEKLSGNDWFIGVIVTPQRPHDLIICSKNGNSEESVEAVKSFLDEDFDGDVLLGIYDDSAVRIFPEGGEIAENFYKMWLQRQETCSGKWGMGGVTNN